MWAGDKEENGSQRTLSIVTGIWAMGGGCLWKLLFSGEKRWWKGRAYKSQSTFSKAHSGFSVKNGLGRSRTGDGEMSWETTGVIQ